MEFKRARDLEQKAKRKQVILDSAWKLYLETNGTMPSVSQIAKSSGLAKGTVYLYFKTKEEIFLSILANEMETLYIEILEKLPGDQPITVDLVIDILVDSVCDKKALLKLGPISSGVLELNIDTECLYRFKLGIADQVRTYGTFVEQVFPQLKPGEGATLLLRTYIAIVGVSQAIPVSKTLEALLQKPELSLLKIDFAEELRGLLKALWRGTVG